MSEIVRSDLLELGTKRSVIREMHEEAMLRAKEIGKEKVYDFSLGNPTIPPPECIKKEIINLENNENPSDIHGYTSSQGDLEVRNQIANDLNNKYGTNFNSENLYMTYAAAASLAIVFKVLTNKEDQEYIVIAPYFSEYHTFIVDTGAKLVVIPPDLERFQINFYELERKITKNTKGVIINSPNNPSGSVYNEETIKKLSHLLAIKSQEFNTQIYIISDEPYRELVYDDFEIPFITKYYNNTIICYSFSKSLSLPGARIGYILVPDEAYGKNAIYNALFGAARVFGYVCTPTLFQKVIGRTIGATADITQYKKNRDLIYDNLTKLGYECVYPQGAFYLLVKALEDDDKKFCDKAKEENIFIVPTSDFGCPGYVRIAYCVDSDVIKRSKEAFERLKKRYL